MTVSFQAIRTVVSGGIREAVAWVCNTGTGVVGRGRAVPLALLTGEEAVGVGVATSVVFRENGAILCERDELATGVSGITPTGEIEKATSGIEDDIHAPLTPNALDKVRA